VLGGCLDFHCLARQIAGVGPVVVPAVEAADQGSEVWVAEGKAIDADSLVVEIAGRDTGRSGMGVGQSVAVIVVAAAVAAAVAAWSCFGSE